MSTHTQYYMNKKRRQEMQNSAKCFLKPERLKTISVNNGIILPAHENPNKLWADGGVLDQKNNFIEESGNGYLFGGKYDYDPKDCIESNEEVIFFGPFIKHWGHFICDLIGRMWYIKDNPKKYKIAYCGWNWRQGEGDIDGNFLELLELLGCNKNQLINVQRPTRFKKIIIPEIAFSGGNYYTKEFESMIDIIVKNALREKIKSPQKVYFSRTKFSTDKERGEKKIEKVFKNNGYKILYPEKLSVKEQIVYINNAEKIAMVSGSISHNLMFARNSNIESIILNKFDLINNYQLVIDDMTKASIVYIDAYLKLRQVLFGMGPFLLYVSKYLIKFLKDSGYSIPKSTTITVPDIIWYYKKHHEIYKIPNYKKLLKSQKESIKAAKQTD